MTGQRTAFIDTSGHGAKPLSSTFQDSDDLETFAVQTCSPLTRWIQGRYQDPAVNRRWSSTITTLGPLGRSQIHGFSRFRAQPPLLRGSDLRIFRDPRAAAGAHGYSGSGLVLHGQKGAESLGLAAKNMGVFMWAGSSNRGTLVDHRTSTE